MSNQEGWLRRAEFLAAIAVAVVIALAYAASLFSGR
jgi:hypothetical protein